jgi:hypothetical protein
MKSAEGLVAAGRRANPARDGQRDHSHERACQTAPTALNPLVRAPFRAQREKAHSPGVSSATVSTWWVMGNASNARTSSNRYEWVAKRATSRPSAAGSHAT